MKISEEVTVPVPTVVTNNIGVDMDAVSNMLAEFMKKSEFDDFGKRIEKCEKKIKKVKDKTNK
jgi:hypothetical protein